jgi:hypothetical protein
VKRLRALDDGDDGAGSGSSGGAGSQAAVQQFFDREAAILASIRHPNVRRRWRALALTRSSALWRQARALLF